MKLFDSTHYTPVAARGIEPLWTPLGELGLRYAIDGDDARPAPQQVWRHLQRDCVIRRFVTTKCEIEELRLPPTPPTPPTRWPNVLVQALIIRLRALLSIEKLDATLHWLAGARWLEGIGSPGEGLESRNWRDADWSVTVGTEDADYLANRCRAGRWMPPRLESYFVPYSNDRVNFADRSLTIRLPPLRADELCQIQFVVAHAPQMDDQTELSLWFAVDQDPKVLLAAGECQ